MSKFKYMEIRVGYDDTFQVTGMWKDGFDLGEKGGFRSKPTFPDLFEFINSLGEKGWELVTVSGSPWYLTYHFKQQI